MYIDPSRKILRHPERLNALRRGRAPWPINVEFDLSDRCNLRCRHCDFAHRRADRDMTLSLARSILAQMAPRIRAVTLTGGGEPTMCPDFEGIVYRIKSHNLALGAYTNGVRFSGAFRLMDWVYVSLDAADAESFYEVKGADQFRTVVDNVGQLALSKDETVLGLGFLLGPHNYGDSEKMAHLGEELGVDYVQFRPIVGLDGYGWVGEALDRLAHMDAQVPVYFPAQRFVDLRDKPPRGYEVCRGSAFVPCIGADGILWVCPNTRGLRALGNLAEESFEEIWMRRPEQHVGDDCREMCRNHRLNQTLEYICSKGAHDDFV